MSRKIRSLIPSDRPREKMTKKGPGALSDFELLEVIIGSGNGKNDVSYLARAVQKLLAKNAHDVTLENLTSIKGISTATATKILASLEVARRFLIKDLEPIITPSDILARLHDIRSKKQEYLVALSLDGGQRLIAERTITIGGLDSLMAHPREVFADAIADRAASIIIGHNHPSGDEKPSPKDLALTQQLLAAGQIVGVPLRDHIILTTSKHFSFRQHHLI